jgi:hypothetical protein
MSIVSVQPKSFILALFIRDDNERFLLGDNGYDFKDSQLHFAANTIENDEVQKQGADGVMVAGQVRRASVQSFDGYVGDATMAKETIEQMRRDFIAFFLKGHHYRVIYVDCNRNAWQRKGGYLVDAPEVKELWQIHPEYHVGLNFEDVNYYSYDEDADGNEILANLVNVPVSTEIEGGLVWDEDGAVSEDAGDISYDEETADATPAKNVYITDATGAPIASFKLDGETSQNGTPTPSDPVPVQTVTGENVVKICGKNLYDGSISETGKRLSTSTGGSYTDANYDISAYIPVSPSTTYTINTQGRIFCDEYTVSKTFITGHLQTYGSTDPITITTASNARYIRFDFPTGNNIVSQLELGSTATAYEPYQGQSYPIKLNAGINYWDNLQSGFLPLSGAYPTTNPSYPNAKYRLVSLKAGQSIRTVCVPGGDYGSGRLRWINPTTNEVVGSVNDGSFEYYSSTKNFGDGFYDAVITAKKDVIFGFLDISGGYTQVDFAIEPINFDGIELCKIGDYQDYIYKSGGKWYVHKAVGKSTVDGTTGSWGSPSTNRFNADNVITGYAKIDGEVLSACDGYPTVAQTSSNGSFNTLVSSMSYAMNFTSYAGGQSLRFKDTSASTTADFRAALEAKPITVYYVLATPTDTEITNEALIAQLDNVASAPLYTGVNNITTITPNEQGTLEISYYTKYQPMVGSGGYVWEAGGAGGPTVIMNNSIDNVSPVWTIYGPTTNPQLENATTGETIEYVGTIAEGQTLTIDMGEQTASLDGLNVISNLVGDFIQLAPGRNNIIYSVSGEAGASELGWSEIVG